MKTIVWFRKDLRLHDQPALAEACRIGDPIIPLYIYSSEEEEMWGDASRWWLKESLTQLKSQLEKKGSTLSFLKGDALQVLKKLILETGAKRVYWNRCYEPYEIKRDNHLKNWLESEAIELKTFNASLLVEPWEIQTKEKKPFQVFTPFWNAVEKHSPFQKTYPTPSSIPVPKRFPKSDPIEIPSKANFIDFWEPGEQSAIHSFKKFVATKLKHYEIDRDYPGKEGVSRMSPHLHFGEISPRTIWEQCSGKKESKVYLQEIGWREFAHHLIYHFPQTINTALRKEFNAFPWDEDDGRLDLWKQGMTGYPIVDAGMRQLLVTGWMHNRVRMIAGSFLTKDLFTPWQEGAKWFWETLVDADLANNTLGWQWVSGCGADAAPYFRIFNPVLQSKQFDPKATYIHQWVPELRNLPPALVHAPWEIAESELKQFGVELGVTYPRPLVDHAKARNRALLAFKKLKDSKR